VLNFIYWPVSAVMWAWYKLFSFIPGLAPDSAITWILSVVFLVFTLRMVLYWPAAKQIRTTRQMQELQPQIKALQKKYKNDRQRMAMEMQKLQKEHGFNPLLGCLPALAQAPMFIGLFHVLRSFNRTGTSFNQLGLTPEENAQLSNYMFSAEDVREFLSANIFGVPLSSFISQPVSQLEAFAMYSGIPERWQIAAVAIPLMIIAAVATHLNSRASVERQSPEAAAQPQARIMNKLALYVFPLGVLVSGAFLPVAILIYWVANNAWTVGQQHIIFGQIEKEEEAKKQRAQEIRSQRAPKPGAVPQVGKKGRRGPAASGKATAVSEVEGQHEGTETGDDAPTETTATEPAGDGLSVRERREAKLQRQQQQGGGAKKPGSPPVKNKGGGGKGGAKGKKSGGGKSRKKRR